MRTYIEWRSSSKENYKDFCNKYPDIDIDFQRWKQVIYAFNESFRNYILETGEKIKFPFGLGEFTINKKKRKIKKIIDGKEYINLPIDWQKTRKKGKYIYNFNFHTNGYYFGWVWFKAKTLIRLIDLWYFKPTRATSRMISHYIKVDEKYQDVYREWKC